MNMKRVLVLFFIAVALAIFEIQIEGPSGWAEKLPCWHAAPGSWQQQVYGTLMNDKPCDGFHLSEIALLLLLFHLPFVWGIKWSLAMECELLASFFLTSICWDFLWFIFNPAFGWTNFDAQHIWWHKYWIGPFPKDYYGGILLVGVLATIASWLKRKENFWKTITKDLLGLISLTTMVAIIAEMIRRLA